MELFFRTYERWIIAASIVAVTAMIALIVSGAASVALSPMTVPELPDFAQIARAKARAKKPAVRPRRVDRAGAIEARCLFGCVEEAPEDEGACEEPCGEGETCVEGACVPSEQESAEDSGLPTLSDLSLELVGVMVASDADYSRAMLTDPSSRATTMAGVDDLVAGEARVVEIHADRIVLERSGRLEYIRLNDSIAGDPSAAQAAARSRPTAARPRPPGGAIRPAPPRAPGQKSRAFERVGENKFSVPRNELERKLNDRASLMKGATVVPNYRDGKKNGLKLLNVTGTSVYKDLGLKSGDVLRSVNGEQIRSQAHALELMERFKKEKAVNVEIERSGRSVKLEYDIQ